MDVEINDPDIAEDLKAMSMAKIASTNRIMRDSILHQHHDGLIDFTRNQSILEENSPMKT